MTGSMRSLIRVANYDRLGTSQSNDDDYAISTSSPSFQSTSQAQQRQVYTQRPLLD